MNDETAEGTENPEPAEAAERMSLGRIVARVSGYLDADKRGTGTLAELRRIGEYAVLPAAFWRFYLETIPKEWREPGGPRRQEDRPCVGRTDESDGRDGPEAPFIRAAVRLGPRQDRLLRRALHPTPAGATRRGSAT